MENVIMEKDYVPYLRDDLGATYHKDYTEFVIWAPLSSEVILNLEVKNGKFKEYPMEKEKYNSFRIKVKGNFLNKKYFYTVTNNGKKVNTNDPWGKGASFNSEYSAVVDLAQVDKLKKVPLASKMNSYTDAIIYELHIRDFTEDKHSDIEDKRHYLGVVEKGRLTWGGHPAGLDYLKFLGITHVQILPIHDFLGADDANPMRGYNWGYNPISYFALEGSYSNHPEIPQSRLLEFKKMVNELHRNDIRVIIDVVYNHVYEYKNTSWQKLVPDYFFRFHPDGRLAESSGCGNDFASETPMGRKMIIDSLKYLVDTFDVDGFRFDLMGIIDVDTINMAYEECKKLKEDVMFYGEGWNMPTALPEEKRASADNAKDMPNIGFFNDTFREIIKGATFDLHNKGFAAGNNDNFEMVRYAMKGCTVHSPYPKRFLYPHQSINYVECHDNHTIFDKFVVSNSDEPESLILERIKFANTITMFSFGVPFFHMGQEIGQSKFGLGNSYNVVRVNNMSWKLVDERFAMVAYFHLAAKLRREKLPLFHSDDPSVFANTFKAERWPNGIICYSADGPEIAPYKKLLVLMNNSAEDKHFTLDDYYVYLSAKDLSSKTHTYVKNGVIGASVIQIYFQKDE